MKNTIAWQILLLIHLSNHKSLLSQLWSLKKNKASLSFDPSNSEWAPQPKWTGTRRPKHERDDVIRCGVLLFARRVWPALSVAVRGAEQRFSTMESARSYRSAHVSEPLTGHFNHSNLLAGCARPRAVQVAVLEVWHWIMGWDTFCHSVKLTFGLLDIKRHHLMLFVKRCRNHDTHWISNRRY